MKKLLLILGIMMMATSLTYAVEDEETTTSEGEGTVAESTGVTSAEAPVGVTLSKGDSFMAAFGMGDSSIVSGGESGGGGVSSTAGSTAVAHTAAHVGSVSLTSSQNTPYTYK